MLKNRPPLYLGLYVDDFIFLSESPEVERIFQEKLSNLLKVEYSQFPQTILGLKIRINKTKDNMSILLTQQATSEELVTTTGLSGISSSVKPTPYRLGHPVDKIPLLHTQLPLHIQSKLEDTYRSLV